MSGWLQHAARSKGYALADEWSGGRRGCARRAVQQDAGSELALVKLHACLVACRPAALRAVSSPHCRVLERALRIDSSTAAFYIEQAGCDVRVAIEKVG